jgi:hypothetical protein
LYFRFDETVFGVCHGSGFVKKIYDSDASIMVIDSHTPDWVETGTIPGAMNIPSATRHTNNSGIAVAGLGKPEVYHGQGQAESE